MATEDDVGKKILRQLEFYFSDSNLPRDTFLKSKTEENPDGFVDLALLCTFKRMKSFGATPEGVAALLEKTPSQTLALSDDKARIKRSTPIPESFSENSKPRTIYAKGWESGTDEPSIESVEALFQPHGKVLCVRLRRWSSPEKGSQRTFKGSVFVEFSTAEEAGKAVEAGISLKDAKEPLKVLKLQDYLKEKQGKRDEAKAKARKAAIEKGEKVPEETPSAPEVIPGLVVSVQGVGPGVAREDLKELLEKFGTVAWIDYTRGEADGHVRFATLGVAVEAIAKLRESKTELGGKVPEWTLLEGEVEQQYWKEVHAAKQAVRARSQKRKRDSHNDKWKNKKNRKQRGKGNGDENAEEDKSAEIQGESEKTGNGTAKGAEPQETTKATENGKGPPTPEAKKISEQTGAASGEGAKEQTAAAPPSGGVKEAPLAATPVEGAKET